MLVRCRCGQAITVEQTLDGLTFRMRFFAGWDEGTIEVEKCPGCGGRLPASLMLMEQKIEGHSPTAGSISPPQGA